MSKQNDTDKDSDDAEDSPEDIVRGIKGLVGIGAGLWVVLVLVAIFHPGITAKVQFATDSSLSLFVLLAVVSQVIIYRRMAAQNERLIRASEKSNKVAEEAFHAGEAPYFGITEMSASDWNTGYFPKLKINYLNGGKTPAWRIHTRVKFSFGQTPEGGDSWELALQNHQMANTFMPAQSANEFHYVQKGFQLTENKLAAMRDNQIHLFVVVEIHYRDFRKVWHSQVFRAIADGHHFRDYDASERDCGICKKKGYNKPATH